MKSKSKNKQIIIYGLSLAASWAWGVSFIVGMETVQSKGIIPFLIWAIANSLALPIFGLIAFGIPRLNEIVDTKIVQVFTTCIMIFCLWIQMNSILEILQPVWFIELSPDFIIILGSLILALFLYKDGLIRNINLDKILWCLCYIILISMFLIALISRNSKIEPLIINSNTDLFWAFETWPILFAGPIMNIQNWQMAYKLRDEGLLKQSHIIAGIFFAIYLALVFGLSLYKFNSILQILQLIAILCITVTTMDAAIVGMQRIAGIKIGFLLAIITIFSWKFVIPMGVLNLWTFMGNRRKEVAIICIIAALVKYFYYDRFKKEIKDVSE